jgi:type II secretory pathway component PulC
MPTQRGLIDVCAMRQRVAWLHVAVVVNVSSGCAASQVEPTDIAPRPSVASSGARPASETAPQPLVVPRAQLDRVLQRGPGYLLADVPLEPVLDDKRQLLGWRIVTLWNDDPRVLRFGVRPGDVLVAAQGVRIVTPGDLLVVFDKLKRADAVEVEVQRGAQRRLFRWPIAPALPP